MTPDLLLAIGGLFIAIALLVGLGASVFLGRRTPERQRLREMVAAGGPNVSFGNLEQIGLTERLNPRLERIAKTVPKSPKEMTRLRRRLATAGIHSYGAAVFYAVSEVVLPIVIAGASLMYLSGMMA